MPLELGPERVAVGLPNAFLGAQAADPQNAALLRDVVRARYGAATDVSVEVLAAPSGATTIAQVETAERKARVEAARRAVAEHPLVTAAIELLGAELRDVRLAADHPDTR
jgi:hypothetical protein